MRPLNGQRVTSFDCYKSLVATSIALAYLSARLAVFLPSNHVHGALNSSQRRQRAGVGCVLRSASPTSLLEFWRLCHYRRAIDAKARRRKGRTFIYPPRHLHEIEFSSALGLMHRTPNTIKIASSPFVTSLTLPRAITASTLGSLYYSTRAERYFVFRRARVGREVVVYGGKQGRWRKRK